MQQPNSDPPPWPRRTPKACASCRRDKIRCDGARPCAGCVKKGFTPEQCIDGCDQCRRARVRCEGGTPCQRCRDNLLDCMEESPAQMAQRDPSRPIRPHRNDRAKLACQNCRRDNKKCDDKRPCSRCVARRETCVHVVRGPKLVKLRCEACRRDNKRCEDPRPCKYCIERGLPCVNVDRKRGHGTRSKAACTNCRRDKIRCDGIRPCSACSRKGFECLDRPCKACAQAGKSQQCTHRRPNQPSEDESFPQASTSAQQIVQPRVRQAHPHAQPPTMLYGLHSIPQFYAVPPPSPLQPHESGSNTHPPIMPHVLYEADQRPAYFPVIDPNIDDPQPQIMSETSDQQMEISSLPGSGPEPVEDAES